MSFRTRDCYERFADKPRAAHHRAGAFAWRPDRDRGHWNAATYLSTLPLAFRAGAKGIVALFRYGVAVLVDMSPLEEDEVIRRLDGRIVGPVEPREEEIVHIEIAPDKDEQLTPLGIIVLKALTIEHTLLIADALATSVVLAHDEKNVAKFST